MFKSVNPIIAAMVAGILIGIGSFLPRDATSHCDTLDGPVIKDAKLALEQGKVIPVLKWVRKGDEQEIRAAFDKTLAVRTKGDHARDLADMYFFETLVRIHRAGEGAPYTGLEPAGTDPGSAVRAADKALESGSADEVIKLVTEEISAGIRNRLKHALEGKKHADESVEAGREFVKAYVEFVHYVERLHTAAQSVADHHESGKGPPEHGVHDHK